MSTYPGPAARPRGGICQGQEVLLSEPETKSEKPAAPKGGIAPTGILQKETDRAARPGFRSPANAKSKAQKAGKKDKK